MLLACVWIYNSMYFTQFPSERQLAQVCMRVQYNFQLQLSNKNVLKKNLAKKSRNQNFQK